MIATSGKVSRVSRPLVGLCRAAYSFVFPPSCPLCHRELESATLPIDGHSVTPILCPDCTSEVTPPAGNRCQRCGEPLGPHVRSDAGCPMCRPREFRFERVVRLGLYDDLLRDACIRGKAPQNEPLSAALANLLWLLERAALDAIRPDVVVPVPRHVVHRVLRPHHQAETLSRVLAKRLRVSEARRLLVKNRLTPDQSDLPATLRKQNLKDAFAVWFGRSQIAGKTVLLVDDILTTGTTANECSRALLRAGAKRVIVAVIAVVPPSRS